MRNKINIYTRLVDRTENLLKYTKITRETYKACCQWVPPVYKNPLRMCYLILFMIIHARMVPYSIHHYNIYI